MLNVEVMDNLLVDVETAVDYLRLQDTADIAAVTRAVNHATSTCEDHTRRKLASREHTFLLSGTGSRRICLPEWPPTALASAKYFDGDNAAKVDIDITNPEIDESGIISIFYDVFPKGYLNVEIVATCGYSRELFPSDWASLEYCALRLTQIYYQDWLNQTGRAVAAGVNGSTVQLDTQMPSDVAEKLARFVRVF